MSQINPTSAIDLNKMAASAYAQAQNVQTMAENLIGLETLWCRAVPHVNSEDIVIQEYTLSNVECPKLIKIIPEKSDYQPGSYNVDLWGISFEQPFEINIAYTTWNNIFGKDTAPQKGDIVYVKIYNRLYEIASSTIQYIMTSLPIAYKCTLRKYQRSASRRENEDVRISIDELTNSQDILFGEHISNEVADAAVERETSYNQSTYVDPIRTFDMKSVITSDIIGESGNLISNAYYDFSIAETPVVFSGISASYMTDIDDNNIHWIYSCWFRTNTNRINSEQLLAGVTGKTIQKSESVSISGLHAKTKNYYEFRIQTVLDLEIGDSVILSRGLTFRLPGVIVPDDCAAGVMIQIETQHVLEAGKKASRWWETIKSGWKLSKTVANPVDNSKHQLQNKPKPFTLLNSDNDKINILTDAESYISVKFGNTSKKTISLKKPLKDGVWHYFCIDVLSNTADIKLIKVGESALSTKVKQEVIINKKYNLGKVTGFNIEGFKFENHGSDIHLCNIRLYESEYPMGDNYKYDMYSQVTRNASKLIVVDNPQPVNNMEFVSQLK